jgi:hypothetical protein
VDCRNSEISAPESRADPSSHQRMSTLSRREEETLFKTTKTHALKECDPLVKGMFSVTCLSRQRHPLCSIRRVCCWTYSFGCLGLQGEVQCRSGLHLPVVSVIFSYTSSTHTPQAHGQRVCSLCGTNISGYAMNNRNNYHHSFSPPNMMVDPYHRIQRK